MLKSFQRKYNGFFKDLISFIAVTLFFTAILRSPRVSSNGAQIGIKFCLEILIPSLFPFMVLSSFVIQSGLSEKIGKLIAPLVKKFFHLPSCTGATILLGLLGGYPTGAIGISELYRQKKITSKQAEQMLLFVVCGGPAFVMSAIGTQISSNPLLGTILFISQFLSAIILGLIVSFFYRNSAQTQVETQIKNTSISSALVTSCLSATKAMLNMCAFVVLFSAFLSIIHQLYFINAILKMLEFFNISLPIINSIIPIFFEVTNGCALVINHRAPLKLLAFTLSWAGLCVHLQIFSLTEDIKFSKVKFLLARLAHAILSTIITHLLLLTYNRYNVLAAIKFTFASPVATCYASHGSLALIILCLVFLLSIPSTKPRRDTLERPKKKSSFCFLKK